MLEMEKSQQIGELVQAREQQKIDLMHLKVKSSKIADAYRAFSSQKDRWCVDPSSSNKVFLMNTTSTERDLPQYLFSQEELAEHVREVRSVEEALASTISQLKSLGISVD